LLGGQVEPGPDQIDVSQDAAAIEAVLDAAHLACANLIGSFLFEATNGLWNMGF